MRRTYLKAISAFALQRTVTRTDTAATFVGVLAPAITTVLRVAVADLTVFVAWVVIAVVGAVAITRLVTAPYFIWKDQNAKIAALETAAVEPERRARAVMQDMLVEDRKKLAAIVVDLKADAWIASTPIEFLTKCSEHRLLTGLFDADVAFKRLWSAFLGEGRKYVSGKPAKLAGEVQEAYDARLSIHLHAASGDLIQATNRLVDWLLYRA